MERCWCFSIAEHCVEIKSTDENIDIEETNPNLLPFRTENCNLDTLIRISIVPALEDDSDFCEVGDFDTGNGHTKVEKNDSTGKYRFLIRNIKEIPVAKMLATGDFSSCELCVYAENHANRNFGINSALMMAFAFAGAFHQTLLIHASTVKLGEYAYAFIAKSGTGKSTQVNNWLKYIADTELLNDDNPVVRVIDGEAFIYGSPWSGKTPCYRQIKARLGAVTRIERALYNKCVRQNIVEAFASFLPSCSTMKWDSAIYDGVINTISSIIKTTGIYKLYCLPDRESAEVCHKQICQQ